MWGYLDLLGNFYRGQYGANFATREVQVEMCDSKEALLNTLRDMRPKVAEQGVRHLAIDPTPGKQTMMVTFDEFIKEIEKN